MDYSFFDAMIDSVFVVASDRGVVYCNEAAAALCESSVRRLTRGKSLIDVLAFPNADELFGDQAFPLTEMGFQVTGSGKQGKGQIAVHPFTEPTGEPRWIVLIRDVTLEEVLHAKYHAQIDQLQEAHKQLEAYSKNLEQMVEERTHEVRRANVMLGAIMDSLGQGFLVFDKNGDCGNFFTKACLSILEKSPQGQKIWSVLGLSASDVETFKMWMQAVFGQSLPFDSLKDLAPQAYSHSQGRHVKLDYFPIFEDGNEKGKPCIANVVLVATDWTSEYMATTALEKEKRYAKMVVKLVSSRRQFEEFLKSATRVIEEVSTSAARSPEHFDVPWAFRALHTLEGEAALYSAHEIWAASRLPQEVLEPLKKAEAPHLGEHQGEFVEKMQILRAAYEKFRLDNKKLFALIGVGAEPTLTVTKPRVAEIVDYLKECGLNHQVCSHVERLLLDQPISQLFSHYEDLVETVAERLHKKVLPVAWQNMDLAVDPERFRPLAAAFVHAFRNAVDHGLEAPEDRQMLGKTAEGLIQFKCERFEKGGAPWIRLQLQDDGQGIDVERLRKKLAENGVDVGQASDHDIMQRVFDPGLSSRDQVSEFSGRGVGLNAVQDEAEKLGGFANVQPGQAGGTLLTVEVPEASELRKVDRLRSA